MHHKPWPRLAHLGGALVGLAFAAGGCGSSGNDGGLNSPVGGYGTSTGSGGSAAPSAGGGTGTSSTDVCCSSTPTWPANGTCDCTLGMRCAPLLPGDADPGCFCALSTTYSNYEPGYEDNPNCVSPPGGKCCFDEEVGTIACWDGITCDPNEREVSSRLLIAPRCSSSMTKQPSCD